VAGLDVEKRHAEENDGEQQHEGVLHAMTLCSLSAGLAPAQWRKKPGTLKPRKNHRIARKIEQTLCPAAKAVSLYGQVKRLNHNRSCGEISLSIEKIP
jgi:hypothetical protein